MTQPPVGVRWTIGDVSVRGWQALGLSIRGAWQVFGASAAYAVCVNTVPLDEARARVGEAPAPILWHLSSQAEIPAFLAQRLAPNMAEGVAWKFAPLRIFPERYEVALDNDCILWAMPSGLRAWLEAGDPERCLLAEDTWALFGKLTPLCAPEPRNTGIRGLPPGFDLAEALRETLARVEGVLDSELDEQGLQVAALSRRQPLRTVSVQEVTICSPFPPHLPYLGTHGAHFVGLNARHLAWQLDGRFAEEWIREHWERHLPTLRARVGHPKGVTSAGT